MRRAATVGYVVVATVTATVSLVWLGLGLAVAVVRYWPGALEALAGTPSGWAQGLREAAPASEPLDQAVLDYLCSSLNLVLAAVLVRYAGRTWSLRLLVIAMVGSAGAFNLQAHAAAVAVEIATGLSLGQLHQIVLHAVACAAYVLALLAFPTVQWQATARPGRPATLLLAAVAVSSLLLVGFGTAALPHTTSCVLFFGFLVPIAGLVTLPYRVRRGVTDADRTRARLLLCALAATFVTTAVLGVVTAALDALGQMGLMLDDPTAHGAPGSAQPTALLFWFSRVASVAIAAAILVAAVGSRPGTAERLFSRGLAIALVTALSGGLFAVLLAGLVGPSGWVGIGNAVIAAVPVALAFLPLYRGVETLTDRLLYGRRATPYSVLAGVAALSRSEAGGSPDLARAVEAIGHDLGASVCRLTVHRPGLRDRTYAWSAHGGAGTDGSGGRGADTDATAELVTVPVRHGTDVLGEVAVDRTAVAGLNSQRRQLLSDIADGLGVVLQASRSGIELERQLRAAVAHGEEIAVARREAVARMDGERRRIERDLHDGAQHHLVTLGLTLGLVEFQVESGQVDEARKRVDALLAQLDVTESVLTETAGGVSSGALAERGLVAALYEAMDGSDPPVTFEHDGVAAEQRYPVAVAETAYFCCLEAVNNVRKHAPGARVTVSVAEHGGWLRMAVRDDGPGFDPGPVVGPDVSGSGRGLRNLAARLTSAGGTVDVRSAPGVGTTVEWALPVPADHHEGAEATTRIDLAQVPVAHTATESEGSPAERVRDLARTAAEAFAGTEREGDLAAVTALLDGSPGNGRADARAARDALAELERIVRAAPAGDGRAERLHYEIERVRSGAHELVELDAVEMVRSGRVTLPVDVRESAERLLGAHGSGPAVRLGLPGGAGPDDVRRVAAEEMARWQRREAHPASTAVVRDVARVAIRTCEDLLAR